MGCQRVKTTILYTGEQYHCYILSAGFSNEHCIDQTIIVAFSIYKGEEGETKGALSLFDYKRRVI